MVSGKRFHCIYLDPQAFPSYFSLSAVGGGQRKTEQLDEHLAAS